MRMAAGILMIIGAILGFILSRAIYSSIYVGFGSIPGLLGWLLWLWVIFVVAGGIYTLKRRVWLVCLIASVLLLPYLILPFLAWSDAFGEEINIPFAVGITAFFFVVGILPLTFIYLRRREWGD